MPCNTLNNICSLEKGRTVAKYLKCYGNNAMKDRFTSLFNKFIYHIQAILAKQRLKYYCFCRSFGRQFERCVDIVHGPESEIIPPGWIFVDPYIFVVWTLVFKNLVVGCLIDAG